MKKSKKIKGDAELSTLKKQSDEVAEILKTIAHPKRLLILCNLINKKCTVQELEEKCEISQSQLSQFLRRMVSEGFLESNREARHVYYGIKNPQIKKLIMSLYEIYCE